MNEMIGVLIGIVMAIGLLLIDKYTKTWKVRKLVKRKYITFITNRYVIIIGRLYMSLISVFLCLGMIFVIGMLYLINVLMFLNIHGDLVMNIDIYSRDEIIEIILALICMGFFNLIVSYFAMKYLIKVNKGLYYSFISIFNVNNSRKYSDYIEKTNISIGLLKQ